jgi:hypothetical protein
VGDAIHIVCVCCVTHRRLALNSAIEGLLATYSLYRQQVVQPEKLELGLLRISTVLMHSATPHRRWVKKINSHRKEYLRLICI